MATKKESGLKSFLNNLFNPKESKLPDVKKKKKTSPSAKSKSNSSSVPVSKQDKKKKKLSNLSSKVDNLMKNVGVNEKTSTPTIYSRSPKPSGKSDGRLVFIIDATASREHSWQAAQEIQIQMFEAARQFGNLHVRLMFFGGDYFEDTGWTDDPNYLKQKMAPVQCIGGYTQYLKAFTKLDSEINSGCVVLVGDCFEHYNKDEQNIYNIANRLGLRKCPVFCLHEGNLYEDHFNKIAEVSGGAYLNFGPGISLQLNDCFKSVAAFSTGGLKALDQLKSKGDKAASKMKNQLKLNAKKPEQFALKKPS